MRVAIVHERFTDSAAPSHVVEHFTTCGPMRRSMPQWSTDRRFRVDSDADVRSSRLQALFRGGGHYAHLLPLLPGAFASLDLGADHLVITSHHAFANRVRPPSHVPVISYTHTPARWIWDASMRRDEPGARSGASRSAHSPRHERGPDPPPRAGPRCHRELERSRRAVRASGTATRSSWHHPSTSSASASA